MKDQWIADLTPDDVPERYRPIAELIGVENLVKLGDYSKGDNIYIPSGKYFLRIIRDYKMKKEYTGGSVKELAKKYGLSERRTREIVIGE
ncbi:Mor transcription activator family protein [Paenibacillus sp. PDC88]|uniref:Mor transcription activator family protein n=1 Tax=Paenibacillus sp. PDC88 TaxID=1884375 RepID=UPI00089B5FB2|nr:Mor transcription activator family protein [Paenibacillus sp. PDC88]SDX82432.1 Mor transcription activator family protein [Paenibacillus sp. PDC88]